jgi:GntR family transcriptional repressor for pyruvate dehydrogenase complex
MKVAALDRPASLVESVCQELAALIRNAPDDNDGWLPGERSLAEKFGVSRGVVREATKRLEQQGMVEIQHGNGIKVVDRLHRPLNEALSLLIPDVAGRLQALNEARLSIEPDAAAFASERATKAQIETMRRIHAELKAAEDNDAAIVADLSFHRAVAEASGNLIYRLVLDSLGELGLASRQRTIGRIGKATAIQHHEAILEAIEAGNAEEAREAMRHHILAAGHDMDLPSLKTNPEA